MKSRWILGALCMLSGTVQAASIYDNGLPTLDFGTQMSEFVAADDFIVSATADISNIRYWSQELPLAFAGSTYWAIHGVSGGLPGTLVQGGLTANVAGVLTGDSNFGYFESVYDIPVNFQLAAGTYFLVLHNGALSNTAGEVLWSPTGSNSGLAAVYAPLPSANNWTAVGNDQAFLISGTYVDNQAIPEPGTVLFVAGGLLCGVLLRRRSQ